MDACTLEDLLGTLGEPVFRVLAAPADLTAPVSEVLLHDAGGPFPRSAPGALLLAVGARAGDVGTLARDAAAAGMAGLVVRAGDGRPDTVAEAEAHGLALLAVDDDAAWHHVHLLLASAVGSRPGPAGGGAAFGDLFALANAVAVAVGGATVVEDAHQRILAYSTVPGQAVDEARRQGILGRQVPSSPENTGQYRALFAAPGPLRLAALEDGELPRLAVAIRAGGETLGSLWVVDDGQLGPGAEEALTRGASTAALLLLRARASAELSRHLTSDLLRRLLDGTADPAGAAHRLGLAADAAVRVAAFALDGAVSAPDGEQTALRLLDSVRLQCEARYGWHACVLVDGTVYALLPVAGAGAPAARAEPRAGGSGAQRHRRLAEDIVRRAGRALRVPVRAGLGDVVADPAAVRGSRDDADLVLRVLGPNEDVAAVAEVRARVTLLRLRELMVGQRQLTAGSWREVLAYDTAHGTDYARTLVCWLDAGCDTARAAKLLDVHPNTCRYRLRQAQQHVGLDLADPDERLVLWLQLRTLGGLRGTGRG
ncbi:PucR family transcriptional regulator [Streptomyces tirandamycinicus]|uniref:PucR family transcriptional regulator n=1 Tax=Streptomyces tirandamycinicus TaxID=2174846 RepID=A0A2S1SPW6_9ACTN|nr:helix-turn-helix domain-containing protein [Streptomyces tirandamycinicus]AWI28439.1 PucR family transcriptional regulator [Streptomyces tirandamycinicus]